jgi:ectoine hydroxylase-related dioxygenase (phytanoyl-CoA dioxygenase family)
MDEKKINQWKQKGFCICDNIIDNDLIKDSNIFLTDMYQNGELSVKDFGSEGKLEFPSNTIIDNIMINEKIIESVQKILDTNEILLVQADAWGKNGKEDYSDFSNNNQRMHMDYGNNSFLHPPEWEKPECVAMIIYLSDTKKTGGGTALVPRMDGNDKLYSVPYKNMPGIASYPFYNDKSRSENYFKENDTDVYHFRKELYNREIVTQPKLGDILFYRLDLWHRGTPVNKGEIRFVVNLLWKKKECFWINCWNPGWTKKMYYGSLEKKFSDMTPIQRSVLGVPLPGDRYWDIKKINLLKMRYPNIDVKPYINGLYSKL